MLNVKDNAERGVLYKSNRQKFYLVLLFPNCITDFSKIWSLNSLFFEFVAIIVVRVTSYVTRNL